jgi:pilus assembly protein CpaB
MARLRGCLWLTAGLVVALLAGIVAYVYLRQAGAGAGGQINAPAAETRQVVVALRVVPVRTQLTDQDVALKEVPTEAVPDDAVTDMNAAVGKLTLVELYPGEIVVGSRLVDPNVTSGDGRTALVVAEDEVLMAIPAEDLMSQVGILKPGDHVDLLFTLQLGTTGGGEAASETEATINLLQNITIAALVGSSGANQETSGPPALLLTIGPQDALVLKYAIDAGGILDIVLRAPGVEGPFETEPVDAGYIIDRYGIRQPR